MTTEDLHRLQTLQAAITEGESATIERNELAFRLWREGSTQREIAEALDVVDRSKGGPGVTHAMIAKALGRMRAARENDLIVAAAR